MTMTMAMTTVLPILVVTEVERTMFSEDFMEVLQDISGSLGDKKVRLSQLTPGTRQHDALDISVMGLEGQLTSLRRALRAYVDAVRAVLRPSDELYRLPVEAFGPGVITTSTTKVWGRLWDVCRYLLPW
jgi:hypothetical protein